MYNRGRQGHQVTANVGGHESDPFQECSQNGQGICRAAWQICKCQCHLKLREVDGIQQGGATVCLIFRML